MMRSALRLKKQIFSECLYLYHKRRDRTTPTTLNTQDSTKRLYYGNSAKELNLDWINNKYHIGISSGASVPKSIVDECIEKILKKWPDSIQKQKASLEKAVKFQMPTI